MGKFRYRIESPVADSINLENAPDGWKDDESIFPRSDTYKGVFRKFSANSLKFNGDGAQKLRDIYAVDNFESEAYFSIYETDYDDYSEFLRFKGKFDFVTYKATDGNDGRNIEINVIDSGFWNTVKNRENIKPQLSQLESLDGFQISGFTNEEQFIKLKARINTLGSFVSTELDSGITLEGPHSVPLTVRSQEDDGAKDVTSTSGSSSLSNAFYQVTQEITQLDLGISFDTVFLFTEDSQSFSITVKQYRSGLYDTNLLGTYSGDDTDTVNPSIATTISFTDLQIDDYFILSVNKISAQEEFENIPPYVAEISILTYVDTLEEILVSGMLVHEYGSRILQITSGVDIPLYSDLIGRENSEPISYATNGDLSQLLITNGERIRGFDKDESPLTGSFLDFFKSLNAITPIGVGIETISGVENIRLEELKYFFDDRIVITVDNASNIEETVLTDRIFNKILCGYNKAEYEKIKGLNEVNQKSEFSTPTSVVQNVYNIVSPIRSDSNAIMNARNKPKSEFPTEDTRYDNDNFFFTVITNDTTVLNGDFTDWADDNTPDDWDASGGTVLRKYILGSDRMMFESGFLNSASRSQDIVYANAEDLNLKISYANLEGYTSFNSYTGYVLTLDTGATNYYYNGTEWIESTPAIGVYYAVNIPKTAENELQSLISYSEEIATMPASGTITLTVFGTIGVIVDDIYLGESQYIAKTSEGFDIIQNTPYGNDSFNLDITPKRNLLNHGSIVRAGLTNKLSQYVKFNTSDKNSTAITKKTTESESVVENEDIQVQDLAESYFKPVKWDFNMIFDKDVIDILNETFSGETKPKYLGMVRFRKNTSEDYKYIWLLNPNTGGESQLGKMSGIEVNTDYITPIEI